jgi:hypothetical protein
LPANIKNGMYIVRILINDKIFYSSQIIVGNK